ncbi:unnamed protein product [Spirodela intermedia]|uniref:Uncharacterized protein n=1 Tax=Spirodela intermedia TaxID=51605 RepID=A0A7I8LMD7_SPIIN|nr:unnamed protein product [Spirodela intermedia]
MPLSFLWPLSHFHNHMLRPHRYLRFTQAYEIDYTKMFSPIVCLNSIHVLLSLIVFIEQSSRYKQRVVSCSSAEFKYGAMIEIVGKILANIFMKSLVDILYNVMCTKLDIFDLYALT